MRGATSGGSAAGSVTWNETTRAGGRAGGFRLPAGGAGSTGCGHGFSQTGLVRTVRRSGSIDRSDGFSENMAARTGSSGRRRISARDAVVAGKRSTRCGCSGVRPGSALAARCGLNGTATGADGVVFRNGSGDDANRSPATVPGKIWAC